jgi:hypothetical protein
VRVKRGRIKPISDKRRAENVVRAERMEEKFGPRPWDCQFGKVVRFAGVAVPMSFLSCFGEVNGHEILKTSQGGSRVDMDNVVPLCNYHNGLIEDEPVMARQLGLVRHSWEQ